jgi:DNA-binding MarR family transcriptional regulator
MAFLRWVDRHSCGDLSYQRFQLLSALHCSGPSKMRDLATELGISPRNMTTMVDALESAGLVARRPHPTDRRATLVEPTPAGLRAVDPETQQGLDGAGVLFDALSGEERLRYAQHIDLLLHAMTDEVGPPARDADGG